jgi:hypothetical protein
LGRSIPSGFEWYGCSGCDQFSQACLRFAVLIPLFPKHGGASVAKIAKSNSHNI